MKASEAKKVFEKYEEQRVKWGLNLALNEIAFMAPIVFPAGSLPDETSPLSFTTRELSIIQMMMFKTRNSRLRETEALVELRRLGLKGPLDY